MRVLGRILVLMSALLLSTTVAFRSDVGAATPPSPDQVGEWSDPFNFGPANGLPSPIAPIHMTVLPNGKVLAWNSPAGFLVDDDEATGRPATPAVLWDPIAGTFVQAPLDLSTDPAVVEDIFCSGHALLADGRLFVAGGHVDKRTGIKKAFIYRYDTNTWESAGEMFDPRWYPTNTLLDNGRMLVASGTITPGVHNDRPEVYNPAPPGSWERLANPQNRTQSNYPFMYVAPNGLVFDAGRTHDSSYLNPTTGAWTAVADSGRDWAQASSVMFGPGRVLNVGGGDTDPPTNLARRIDLNTPTG